MRRLIVVTLACAMAAVIACQGDGRHDMAAANAAKEYYDQLIGGQYELFVDGMNYPNAIPDSYRQQLVDNARMYMAEQQRSHQGLREVRVVNCVCDSSLTAANAFLLLSFADSTIEQVVVPMVKRQGRWYMK